MVIGVVEDVKNLGLENPPGTEVYFPPGQTYTRGTGSSYMVLRSHGAPSRLMAAVRHEVRQIDPSLPVTRLRSLSDVVSGGQSGPRFLTQLITVFSIVALLLAAVGIYGVISYSVAQRTKEFGVRMALGAQKSDVLGSVLGRGMMLAACGITTGLGSAFVLTRFLSTLLFGVTPTDLLTFTIVSILLGIVALLASYIPARRATTVNPMVALRYE